MTKDQIPDFVEAVLATGCDICAVAQNRYVLGDSDLPPEIRDNVREEHRRIELQFRERDDLLRNIADYLRSIGRVFTLSPAAPANRSAEDRRTG
jgi:hypothetical protein